MGEGIISGKWRLVFLCIQTISFYAGILFIVFPTLLSFSSHCNLCMLYLLWFDWLTNWLMLSLLRRGISLNPKKKREKNKGKKNPKQPIGLRKHRRMRTWTDLSFFGYDFFCVMCFASRLFSFLRFKVGRQAGRHIPVPYACCMDGMNRLVTVSYLGRMDGWMDRGEKGI